MIFNRTKSPDADYVPSTPVAGARRFTAFDKLYEANWAQWCREAAKSLYYCRLCGWPLDFRGPGLPLFDTCEPCRDLHRVIAVSHYFATLDRQDQAKRKNAGMDDLQSF
jgi:hypothetical protein